MTRAAQAEIDAVQVVVEESPPSKLSRLKLILIATMVLLLLGAGGGVTWYLLSDPEAPEEEAAVAKSSEAKPAAKDMEKKADKVQARKPSTFLNLETLTVNLQSDAGDRILQTTIVLELSDEKSLEAIKTQMPVIRSRLLLLLSSKNAAELNTPRGKEKLAAEIMDETRRHFAPISPEQGLLDVHFNSFVIQ